MAIYPTSDQIQTLLAGPADQPVVMINLLRFKRTSGNDFSAGETSYRAYADKMRVFVESKGGRFLWMGRVDSLVIGDGESFDVIGLVEYPSRAAFVAIATDPHVQAIAVDRTAGLESQLLIATTAEEL